MIRTLGSNQEERKGGGGHVARMGDMRSAYRNFMGIPDEKNHLENLGIVGRIILK